MVPESDIFLWRLGIRTSPEKPGFLVLGFQTDREGNLQKKLGLFDNCKLQNAYVLLNNPRYPAIDYNANFQKNHYNKLYRDFYQFMKKFYGRSDSVSSTSVDPVAYNYIQKVEQKA